MERRYWDSVCFLAWLLPEAPRVPACRTVLNAAERGEVEIVTSALTLTEVIKLKGQPPLKIDQEKRIKGFFENDYIIVRNVDRFIGETARDLIWQFPALHPKDSLHLATAIRLGIPYLDTFDDGLIALDGQVGNPGPKIGPPQFSVQDELPLLPRKTPPEGD
jgi:predicted nucleic acid-binding protein